MFKVNNPYDVCVIDIGSPKLGNIGWCFIEVKTNNIYVGKNLNKLIPLIGNCLKNQALILGLEAPLFVPLRGDLLLATKARKGEGSRPWSAGAGAQVLAMNLPIMTYLFQKLKIIYPAVKIFINEVGFNAKTGQLMVFEALVSGSDKGQSHIDDAKIMAGYCRSFSIRNELPPSILEEEKNTEFFNLTAASLIRCGLSDQIKMLHQHSPIYKPLPIQL